MFPKKNAPEEMIEEKAVIKTVMLGEKAETSVV